MQTDALLTGHRNTVGGPGLLLSRGCEIRDEGPVVLGADVVLGPGVIIHALEDRGVWIGARTWVGEGAQIMPGARIGEGAMICAGTIVDSEVPANAVLEGNPPRIAWYLK